MSDLRQSTDRTPRPESDAIATRLLSRVAVVAIFTLIVVAALTMALLERFSTALPKGSRFLTPQEAQKIFAAPRLEPVPATDIARQRAEKQALLSAYQWVDREHGIVRIPIDQAMARLTESESRHGDRP
jgi:hypothetical protein